MSVSVPSPPSDRVRAWRTPLDSALEPAQAVLGLRGDRRPFALSGQWLGQAVVLGSEPVCVGDAGEDPFALLDSQPELHEAGEPPVAVGGGWVGWLGYGLGHLIERLPPSPPAPLPRPAFSLAFYDHVVIHDGERWWFEALATPEREEALRARLELWRARLSARPGQPGPAVPTPFHLTANGADGHLAAVGACVRRIAAGELFQANLCVRLEAQFNGDPLDLFARALAPAQPRFGALVDGAVSLSPERFLRRAGRLVQSEPIKGTRPRVGGEREREQALAALEASAKDAAEHVMIVDLMRNDLGRVCAYGTVRAHPPRAEPHAGVWHLVSTVSGVLRDGVGDGELLRATFPPGSVTGAPKVQAMKVIATLEATRRELYTGAIGIASPVAGLDLSVAIRTFELAGGRIWFGAGGGIVADSDPELELAEALAKGAGPIAAIGGRLPASPPRRSPARAAPAIPPALAHGHRPDPRHGVFETILVRGGEPVAFAQHLRRLAASLQALYGIELDEEDLTARARAAGAAAPHDPARLRLLAGPGGEVTVTVTGDATPPARPLRLAPFSLPGGLGAHKWRDRSLLEALAAAAPGAVPLLVDTDGLVLEAAHANLWIVEDGTLVTPPADGRILPGTTRARLLAEDPAAREEPIPVERLAGAGAVLLSSSISGHREALFEQSL